MAGDLPSFVRSLFPQASAELRALHQIVIDNGPLLAMDFLSIQDLLAISGYGQHESLHVLLLLMFLALQEGSLSVEISPAGLSGRLADLAGDDQAGLWTPRILADLGEYSFPLLISLSPRDPKPLVLHIMGDQRHLYFHKFLRSEMVLRDELLQRLATIDTARVSQGQADWPSILHDVLRARPLRLQEGVLELDADQFRAVDKALRTNFVIISGGPGTGKTSIVLTLLRCLMRGGLRPEQVALAAPTGRAAQRLTDSLRLGLEKIAPGPGEHDLLLHQLQAGTLHHLLEYSPTRGYFRRHAENPLQADVVIVDEVSMVGVVLMAQLLQALRPQCKLILLGDKDQLPSVEAGAVLASLVPSSLKNESGATASEMKGREIIKGSGTGFLARPDGLVPGGYAPSPPPLSPGVPEERGEEVKAPGSPSRNESLACAAGSESLAGAAGPNLPPPYIVLLKTNHRSQPEIQAAALAINQQDAGIASRLPGLTLPGEDRQSAWWKAIERQGGCWLLEPTAGTTATAQTAELRRVLQRWAVHHFLDGYPQLVRECELRAGAEDDPAMMDRLRRLFRILEGNRILTLVREGAWGCVGINQHLDGFLRPSLDRGSRGHLFAGAPVLITANDHVRRLYNGDVGLVLKNLTAVGPNSDLPQRKGPPSGSGSLRAVFPRHGGFESFAVEALPSHELGLALTVHKSQGSEYDSVLVVLPPSGARRLLTKEILYTGVTRARNLALIAGSRDVLRLAIRRKIVRESALLDF